MDLSLSFYLRKSTQRKLDQSAALASFGSSLR